MSRVRSRSFLPPAGTAGWDKSAAVDLFLGDRNRRCNPPLAPTGRLLLPQSRIMYEKVEKRPDLDGKV
jgi:hypothetical protein